MNKTCENCFHNTVCCKANSDDHGVGETCSTYVHEGDVIVESRTGQFEHLTDEIFELFTALQKSGFNDETALELTKAYSTVAFERNAEWLRNKRDRGLQRTKPLR